MGLNLKVYKYIIAFYFPTMSSLKTTSARYILDLWCPSKQ